MAARAVLTAAASSLSRSSSANLAVRFVPRRVLSSGGDHHGPPKINFWEDPLSPSKWKEEHIVILSLSGWGLIFYGGYKAFSGKKENEAEAGEKAVLPA